MKEVCEQIEKLAFKYIDEYLQRKVSIFNTINKINYGSKIASIVLYKARKEVLEKKKNSWVSPVWSDEITLITRISED